METVLEKWQNGVPSPYRATGYWPRPRGAVGLYHTILRRLRPGEVTYTKVDIG